MRADSIDHPSEQTQGQREISIHPLQCASVSPSTLGNPRDTPDSAGAVQAQRRRLFSQVTQHIAALRLLRDLGLRHLRALASLLRHSLVLP